MQQRRDERRTEKTAPWSVLKGYALSVGIALVFYVFNFPLLHGNHERIKYFLICLMYGSVIYSCIWAMYLILWLVTGHALFRRERKVPLLTHTVLSISGTAIGVLIAQHIDAWASNEEFTFSRFSESILYSVFIALTFQFYYAWKHSQQENLALKVAKAEAELHVLRNQMQPHFLFNSLNSLAALIDADPATAGEATQRLADLYRLILDASKQTLSPLEREVRIARLYLEVEKIRFGRRLSFQLPTLGPGERDLLVPSLVIQTLVENAVKHGISGSLEGGLVQVVALREPNGVRLEILNSGAPLFDPRDGGTGLRNTKERLQLAFGDAHGFRLGRNADGITAASFLIPEKA